MSTDYVPILHISTVGLHVYRADRSDIDGEKHCLFLATIQISLKIIFM